MVSLMMETSEIVFQMGKECLPFVMGTDTKVIYVSRRETDREVTSRQMELTTSGSGKTIKSKDSGS
jgi:hypothetical protein